MPPRLSLLLKLSQRQCSMNLNSASTSTAPNIDDFSFSDRLIATSSPKIDRYCDAFLRELSEDLGNLRHLEQKIEKIRQDLRFCFKNHSEIGFVPIGSASNSLLHRGSDLDLVLIPSKTTENWKKFERKFEKSAQFRNGYMQTIGNAISSKRIGHCKPPFFHAKTPIIRFESNRKLQVDIQFASCRPIRSSIFIKTCVQFDERVALLIHWLYKKFEESRILNSSARLFSRYHCNILVIHFLQAIPCPILPDIIHLAPWCSPSFDRLELLKMTRQKRLYVIGNGEMTNEMSVGSLAIQLVDYFSQIDFGKHAIDTRGRILRRSSDDTTCFDIHDEYFSAPTCRVVGSPQLLTDFFSNLKDLATRGRFDDLFCYHFL